MSDTGQVTAAWGPAAGAELTDTGIWRRLRGRWLPAIIVVMAFIIIVTVLLVPVLPIADPLETDYDLMKEGPSLEHPFGTDLHGRDELSRVLWAARTSLLVGVVSTGMALAIGITVGGLAGYGGRHIDSLLMRAADVFLAFPVILGAIAILAMFGSGRRNVFIAIAVFSWPVFARLFRSSVLSIRERGFVKAAKVLGASDRRIFMVHILPNSIGPLITYSTMAVAAAILAEAGLSFIGLGVQLPHPSWGLMLEESMGQFESAPWLIIAPGCAVTITALVFILLGVVLSRLLDPKTRAAGGR